MPRRKRDCMDCGQCGPCIDRAMAYAEDAAEERFREQVRAYCASRGPWAVLLVMTEELREPFLGMGKCTEKESAG